MSIGQKKRDADQMNNVQALTESENRFRLLSDSMPQFVWCGNAQGELTYFNAAVRSYSGLSPEEIKGGGWIEMIHPDDREENLERWQDAIRTGTDFSLEHRFRRHDGVYHWHLSRAVAQKDESGAIVSWVGTSTDINDQKIFAAELEKIVDARVRELREANNQLAHTNHELEQFAYIASHDLQEPLRKIQTFGNLLHRNINDPVQLKKYIDKINFSAARMSTLIGDVLKYSRLKRDQQDFKKVNLETMMKNVLVDFELVISERKAKITLDLPFEITAIPHQLGQLFSNLLSNSLKFCVGRPMIMVRATKVVDYKATPGRNKEFVYITFRDNGIGFEAQYSEEIFTIFKRLNSAARFDGTGIGLAICKKIVDNHNGFISADSIPGKGATFHIYLPVDRAL